MKMGCIAWMTGVVALWVCLASTSSAAAQPAKAAEEIAYSQDRKPSVPWSIHVIRVPRLGAFEIHSAHGLGRAVGLATVSSQARGLNPDLGIPLAAINGDFYRRQGAYVGDPRGLQIMDGELISAPVGEASFWIDALGEPHAGETVSLMRVTWPNGGSAPIGLNETRRPNAIVLYTPALGDSTLTKGGRELVLERADTMPWLPLRAGRAYVGRVAQIRQGGNTPLRPETLVLSIGPGAVGSCPQLAVGDRLQISTATSPNLRGVKTAIGGGPILVRGGKVQRMRLPDSDSYEVVSMTERHPRSAVGWNDQFIFFVVVDGRQKRWSIGMTLPELAGYLVKLGCTDALNLDGGGSATLWDASGVRNRPCDGHERVVANSLVVVRKKAKAEQSPTAETAPTSAAAREP
jgi:hypothetical protein